MKIVLERKNAWSSSAKLVLHSDIEKFLNHQSLRKHPLARYNTSYSTVMMRFEKTIDELALISKDTSFLSDWASQLLECQQHLLYSIMEYLDDCWAILKSFSSSDELKGDYRKRVDTYHSHISRIVNHIKHEQGRLRAIIFFNDYSVLPGYFVENVVDETTLGPHNSIHRGNTAFSFARDLRYHLFNFYKVGEELGDTIWKIVGSGVESQLMEIDSPNPQQLFKVTRFISELPLLFYPDEIAKPVPSIGFSESDSGEIITLTYPDKTVKVPKLPKPMKVVVEYIGDSVTRTYKLPYSPG